MGTWSIIRNNGTVKACVTVPEDELVYYQGEDEIATPGKPPSKHHIFLGNKWVLSAELQTTFLLHKIRAIRTNILNDIDQVYCNAERWSSMTPEKQQEWANYKQALRDFPETCDPGNPVWPEKPT